MFKYLIPYLAFIFVIYIMACIACSILRWYYRNQKNFEEEITEEFPKKQ